jgi:nickel/cobalt exporter
VLVAWGGIAINAKWSRTFPLIAGGALIAIGLFYLLSRLKGSHGHVHLFGGSGHHERHQHHDDAHLHGHHGHNALDHHHHEHDEIEKIEHQWSRPRSDWAVIAGLVALLTFSPCEAFLPVFLTGAKYGWFGFALLSAILAIATVAGMIVFTWLTLLGLQRLRFKALEKYEPIAVGVAFCLLGLIILFEH